jgi:hypothetical protein
MMLAGRLPAALMMLAFVAGGHAAHAHGIAGNRFFPGTLAFDDPAVADEAIVPLYSTFKHPAEIGDGQVVDNAFNWSLFRLLTPTLGVGVDSGWVHRNWGVGRRSGFDITSVDLKGEVYRNDLHEILVAAGTTWGIGRSGAQGAGANAPNLVAPGIFFGKGFGDLPDSLAWLRPFGVTGGFVRAAARGRHLDQHRAGFANGSAGTAANSERRGHALGLGGRIQHALSDQPVHARQAAERRAAQSVCAARGVCIRFGAGEQNFRHDESRSLICGGDLAACGRGYHTAQRRCRTLCRRTRAAAVVPRRLDTRRFWKAAIDPLNAGPAQAAA